MLIENLSNDFGQENHTIVLMVTCYKRRQVWDPFYILFKRYWPDCPYQIVMVTDIGFHPNIPTIQMGVDYGWSNNLISALNLIDRDRIIFFQEDFLLTSPVETEVVRKLVWYSRFKDIGYLRLCPCPGPSGGNWEDVFLGILDPSDPIRTSLQLSIWDKDVLLSLLREGESAWDFEARGSTRSRNCSKPFLSLWRESYDSPGGPIRYFITAVSRGTWEKGALELLRHEGISTNNITVKID